MAFNPDGGANPLKQWCEEHGVPPFRRLNPDGHYVGYGGR